MLKLESRITFNIVFKIKNDFFFYFRLIFIWQKFNIILNCIFYKSLLVISLVLDGVLHNLNVVQISNINFIPYVPGCTGIFNFKQLTTTRHVIEC